MAILGSSWNIGMSFSSRKTLSAPCSGFSFLGCISFVRYLGAHLCKQHDHHLEPGSGSFCLPIIYKQKGKSKALSFPCVLSPSLSLLNCILKSYWSLGWVIAMVRWKQSWANIRGQECVPLWACWAGKLPQERETPITSEMCCISCLLLPLI